MLRAYRDRHALAELLSLRLNRVLASIAPNGRGMDEVVFAVIYAAEGGNWLQELVAGMLEDRREDRDLQRWAEAAMPAPQRPPGPISLDFDELRRVIQETLDATENDTAESGGAYTDPAFESLQIRGSTVTLSARFPGSYRRITLRIEGRELTQGSERQRFSDEAAQAREVSSHPRVMRFAGHGFTGSGYPYIAQLIDQETVPYVLPMPVEKVIDIGAKLADALSYAHSAGAVFGIIEPNQILLTADGEPVLSFPSLPMFAPPAGTEFAGESRDVHGLCSAISAMLAEPPLADSQDPAGRISLSLQARDLLRSGMQTERRLRPTAAVLRDQLNTLKRNAAGTQNDITMSATFTIRSRASLDVTDVVVTGGNLFAEQSDIVVAFSDTFDTAIEDGVVISSSSIQGQLIDSVYDGDVKALDRALEQALPARPVATERRRAKALGKLKRYRIGTVAVLEAQDRRIFAVAVSRMGNDLVARSSYEFLQQSLDGLWAEIRRNGGRPVAMPIIGSGLARVDVNLDSLLHQIMTSFSAETRSKPICIELRIIILPSDLASVDIVGAASSALGLSS